MPDILTITFSPCIDKSTAVPALIPEKKLHCEIPKLEPGGGGINVARAIKKLGGEATALYPAGGYSGKYFTQLLSDEKVPAIIIETENNTRENIVVLDQSTQKQYRFGMPGTLLHEKEWRQCITTVENLHHLDFVIASGSLPPGVPENIFAQLAVITNKKNAKLIVDTSGKPLQAALREGLYLLKPNLAELASLAGREVLNEDQVIDTASQIVQEKHCEIVVVSMGASGAILVTKKEIYRAIPPVTKPVSTVGAGDSMVAGLILALSQKKSLKEVLAFSIACGTAATLRPGTGLCRIGDVLNLLPGVHCYPVRNLKP